MPLFALICTDNPDSLELRVQTRPAHLEYLGATDAVRLGGPTLDAAGKPSGSILVIEAEDLAAAQVFANGDPYALAGLFAKVEIRPFNRTVGSWA